MARYLIQTPVKGASTDVGSVHFHQGKAEMDEVPQWLRQYCEQAGYSITDTQPPAPAEQDQAAQADDEGVGDDDNNPVTPPPANAKVSVWREHAIAVGGDPAAVNQMSRDELVAQFGTPKESEQQ